GGRERRNRGDGYMPATTIPQVRFRTIGGARAGYADSGGSHESADSGGSHEPADSGGSHKPTVVLTSPWPESVYAFAPMWSSLSEHARLFAVDLPGFGASERR